MIIFGTRGVTSTKGRGRFYCPQCGPDSAYAQKRARRFFTLYFIPIVPMDKLGEYVECQDCEGTFHVEVLDMDPDGGRAQIEAMYLVAMKQVLIATLLADGVVDDDEVELLQTIVAEAGGITVTLQDLREEIAEFEGRGIDPTALARELAGVLNDRGRESVLVAALRMAAADGVVDASELAEIERVGEALGMTHAHVAGVLSHAVS